MNVDIDEVYLLNGNLNGLTGKYHRLNLVKSDTTVGMAESCIGKYGYLDTAMKLKSDNKLLLPIPIFRGRS